MRYHNITMDDMLNGDGLRTVLWVSGCNHYCHNCQNKMTWDPNDGLIFDDSTFEELKRNLSKDYISGITFSGGDPLYPGNREEITRIAKEIRNLFPNKTIWLYTGYLWEEIKDLEVIKYIDVLVDGEYVESLRDASLKWKGSGNQCVIDVQKSLEKKDIVLYA